MDSNSSAPLSPVVPPARVLLVDSHPVILAGLAAVLAEHADFLVVDKLDSGAGVVEAVRRHRPDLLLMDLRLKDVDGLRLVQELASLLDLCTRLTVLTTDLTHDETIALVRLGVRGVLLKEMPVALIVQCLRRVQAGGQWLERDSMALALEQVIKRETDLQQIERALSKRELELAMLVAKGVCNKTASRHLSLSEGSVRVYLNRIYTKLKVANRMELSLHFRERGLI
jgi:two-component system, NarL family, nitrate/nitrite response regulator NarL